ncbi:methyltransferase domain-containing protein [Paenibacillus sp. FSL H8-0537]|uniref:methyltransferase domain-containing protein n=1 Tax=Paenibacillus sp. FSL H8-0537 TaxID=2921399 RepID=UPI0031018AD1
MDKYSILHKIKAIYQQNGNIIQHLKKMSGSPMNSTEDIMISYDFQAGSYIAGYKSNPVSRDAFSTALAKILDGLESYDSLLEVGVGEGTMLGITIPRLQKQPDKAYGFDISWSRIKYAKAFIKEQDLECVRLLTGDMFQSPFKDNAIDVVYATHSIESNGGREEEALKELYRIAAKFLVLLEPTHEFSSEEAKKRMQEHGYVKDLYSKAVELGYDVIEHRPFEANYHELNPVSVIIIRKNNEGVSKSEKPLCCPITKSELIQYEDCYYSPESLLAYPILGGIPCLLPQNAIVATKYQTKLE